MLLQLILAATLSAPPRCTPIRADVARRLAGAATLAELDAAATGIRANEVALRALYRTRRLDMNPTAEEERRYFNALPETEQQFRCICELTHPDVLHSEGGDASCGIFERAPRIVRRLGIGHDRIIDLTMWSDGEVAYHAWKAFQWLLDNDRELMAAALRRYPRKELRGCDGSLAPEMSTAEVVKRCSSADRRD